MKIILDTTEEVRTFRSLTAFMDPWQPFFEQVVDGVLEYIMDRKSALDSLNEYVDSLEEDLEELKRYTSDQITEVSAAVLALGEKLYQQLVDIGAYTSRGELHYQYSACDGYDIILEPSAPHPGASDDDEDDDDSDAPF